MQIDPDSDNDLNQEEMEYLQQVQQEKELQ